MNLKNKHIIKYVTSILFQSFLLIHASTNCNRSCGTTKHIPFPFGFSSGCAIPLRCAPNDTILIGEFPVHKIAIDTILVDLPAKCGRPLKTLHQLFTKNFAPTSSNGILLQNCTAPVTGCVIPTTAVQTHLEMLDCDNNNNKNVSTKNSNDTISCYSEQNIISTFVDYGSVERTGCKSLISAISTETYSNSSAVSLEVGVVQLGWWLEGGCRCSSHATCTKVVSPDGKDGYRCQCVHGFSGDGFRDGDGCRKESGCNASRYLSGHCGGTTRVAVLIGGVVAAALLMVSAGVICCYFRRRSKSNTGKRQNRKLFETKNINIPVYPYKEIEKATHSFSEKRRLGTGAYATVYSGKLHNDDQWVAIKRIKHRADTDNIELVMNEIKLLSSVSHPHLVRLLGCSIENDEQILVYEYMPNGTLCQHLHRDQGNGLPWPIRLTIASETAKAIAYLHSDIHPPIYHRDIKSSNILLDYDYKAKVADFGLSRLGMTESSHISTAPQGTPGYLDPQYHQNFHLSDRSDVYSFGVVLVEIITALKVVDFTRGQNEVNLASLAIDRIGKGRLVEIIDPFILQSLDDSTFSSLQKLAELAELAFRCLAFHSEMRPSMTEVADELEHIRLSNCASVDESSSNLSNIPPRVMAKKPELMSKGMFGSVSSVDSEKNYSPVSVQDTWLSDRSSPSSNSLLSNSIH